MHIGIIIYPDVEVLDFCGPFEVFRNVSVFLKDDNINVFTISEKVEPINCQGLIVTPSYSLDDCPDLDILVIPGGSGSWLKDQEVYQQFVNSQFQGIDTLLTVCTGALLPARIGIFTENMPITTHQEGLELLLELAPTSQILPKVRFTHSDKVITSGGISAGIDSSLYLVSDRWGLEVATKIARYMEYNWTIRQPNIDDPSLE